eukprot:1196508-Lingulodinium_polyedra.AAC.1
MPSAIAEGWARNSVRRAAYRTAGLRQPPGQPRPGSRPARAAATGRSKLGTTWTPPRPCTYLKATTRTSPSRVRCSVDACYTCMVGQGAAGWPR